MRSTENRVLVIRSSAMGDVALTAPVLSEFMKLYPGVELVMLTRKQFNPLIGIPDIKIFNPDYRGVHKGLAGIFKIRKELGKLGQFDYVIDLHNVMRSKLLRLLFRISGASVSVIDKGRNEKRCLIEGRNRIHLKHVIERYADAFARAGFRLSGRFGDFRYERTGKVELPGARAGVLQIGIAPFAMHKLKVWPVNHLRGLLVRIKECYDADIWLFGGGPVENEALEELASEVQGLVNLSGRYSLAEEIDMMGSLDAMIAMDSANMHLAALAGTRVVSVWGGTHSAVGFGPYGSKNRSLIAEISWDELECRPCTVYGKGECRRGDFACMEWLTDEMVFGKLREAVGECTLLNKSLEG